MTDPAGAPVAGACVEETGGGRYSETRTDSDGRYVLEGLHEGPRVVSFRPCEEKTHLLSEAYRDRHPPQSGDPVTVAAGQTVTGIDAQLDAAGSISGRLTDAEAHPASDCVEVLTVDGSFVAYAKADAEGRYVADRLPGGAYKVAFVGCEGSILRSYWQRESDLDSASVVRVTAGERRPGIDGRVPGGRLTGTIRRSDGDDEPFTTCVYARSSDHVAEVPSGDGGGYVIAGLPAGRYKIFVDSEVGLGGDTNNHGCYPSGTGDLFSRWYDGADDEAAATQVLVRSGSVTRNIDVELIAGASIGGRVTNRDGAPMQGLCVSLEEIGGSTRSLRLQVLRGSNGAFRFGRLHAGTYRVGFAVEGEIDLPSFPWSDSESYVCPTRDYPLQYHDRSSTAEEATPITVGLGDTVLSIDATIPVADTGPTDECELYSPAPPGCWTDGGPGETTGGETTDGGETSGGGGGATGDDPTTEGGRATDGENTPPRPRDGVGSPPAASSGAQRLPVRVVRSAVLRRGRRLVRLDLRGRVEPAPDGCTGARATVVTKARRRTLSARRVTLSRGCRFATTIRFVRRRLERARALHVLVAFDGTATLLPADAPRLSVPLGR